MHTALVAGRAASRWATSASMRTPSTRPSSSSIITCASATLRRPLSTTRPSLQEAEATAPAPQGMASLAADINRFKQQHAQAQEAQRPLGPPPQSALQSARQILATSGSSSPPRTPPTAWGSAGDRLAVPWSARHRSNSIIPQSSTDRTISDLGIDSDPVFHRPDPSDLDGQAAMQLISERPVDIKYRLHPVIGRTVELNSRVDVARALAILNMKCATNKVKLDFNKQKFYERAGLKKKRLRRERWRVSFKEGFKANCARVRDLAKQGW